jgi:hypothetical protein
MSTPSFTQVSPTCRLPQKSRRRHQASGPIRRRPASDTSRADGSRKLSGHIGRLYGRCGGRFRFHRRLPCHPRSSAPCTDIWQDLYPGKFVSFKRDCIPYPPEGASVVCFHGERLARYAGGASVVAAGPVETRPRLKRFDLWRAQASSDVCAFPCTLVSREVTYRERV